MVVAVGQGREGGRPDRRGAPALRDREGLPDDEVRVRRTEQNWAEIKAGKVEFKVVGMSDRDYPKLPAIQEAQTFKVDAAVLRDMIAKTIFSVSLDETRQHLAGVLFESDGTTARMVSTDGHRLSKVVAAAAGRAEARDRRHDPAQGHGRAAARDRDARGAVARSASTTGNFVLKADDVGISVKLIDGQFPPYDQVIPKDNERAFVVSRAGVPRRAQARGADVVGQDVRREAGASRRGSSGSRATTPTSARREEEIDVDYKGDAGPDRLQRPLLHRPARRDRDARGARRAVRRARPGRRAAGRRQRLRRRRHADAALTSCAGRRPCASASCAPRAGATSRR